MEPVIPPRPEDAISTNALRRYLPVLILAVVVVAGALVAASTGKSASDNATRTTTKGSGAGPSTTFDDGGPMTPEKAKAQGITVDFGPNCDPATGRIKVPTIYAPPCIAPATGPGSGDNGGATSPGVTATEIVVAVYQAASDPLASGLAAAGGASDTPEQTTATLRAYVAYFQAHYEMYGRTIRLVTVKASGSSTDDAAARADAIRVSSEIKAFASLGGPSQTEVYGQELAARKVLCIGCSTGTTDANIRAHAPYLWGAQPSPEQGTELLVELLGKQVKGHPASFAGDPAIAARERRFGLISYDTPTGTFGAGRDAFTAALTKAGVVIASSATYFLELAKAQELASTLVTKMKSADVTTVIFAGDPFMPIFLTKEATAQKWFPEWVMTGTVLTDTTFFGRLYDKQQWSHAFGLSLLTARVRQEQTDAYHLHQWQFGTPPAAAAGYALIYPNPVTLFTGIHLAGAKLTPETFRDGLFRYPPTGGGPTTAKISWGRHGLWPEDDYLASDDATLAWWDPTATGPDEIGKAGTGMWRYQDGGARYVLGAIPSQSTRAFDPAGSVTLIDTPPPGDQAPDYPSPAAPLP